MTNKKIKSWHLDDSLRLQIENSNGSGGSSANLEAALAQYVKKTDKITRTQLADSVFDNVNTSIGNLRNELGQYRNNATPIGRSDLSSGLITELDNLALTASSLPEDFDTRVNTAINNKINSQAFQNQIVGLVSSDISTLNTDVGILKTTVGDSNSGLVKNVDTLQTNVSTLQTAVGSLQTTAGSLQTAIGSNSSGIIKAVNDNASDISDIQSSISDIDSSVSTLSSNYTSLDLRVSAIENTSDAYRLITDKIAESDLSNALVNKINGYGTDITSIQSRLNIINSDGKAVLAVNVAETSTELANMKTALVSPIIYAPTMVAYAISNLSWNVNAELIDSTSKTYSDFTLSSNNISAGSLTPSVNNGIITVNNNTNNFESLLFGIYGKDLKLEFPVSSGNSTIPITIIIDNQFFSTELEQDELLDINLNVYIENLSHGAHRIEIIIGPNTELKINNTIGITDSSHSGLLITSDVPVSSTYNNIMYDNVNYFDLSSMNGTYGFTEPSGFDTIDSNSYTMGICRNELINHKIIYSEFNNKAYIIDNRKLISFNI